MTPPGPQASHPRGHGLLTSARLISGLAAATIVLNDGVGAYFELYDMESYCAFSRGRASLPRYHASKTHHTEVCSCDPHTFTAADHSTTREVCPALGRASGPRGTAARCLIFSTLPRFPPSRSMCFCRSLISGCSCPGCWSSQVLAYLSWSMLGRTEGGRVPKLSGNSTLHPRS